MASFAVIVDPDPDRRAAARRALLDRIAPLPHLESRWVEKGCAVVAWAVAPGAPHQVSESDGEVTLVLGQPIGEGGPASDQGLPSGAESWLTMLEDGFHIVLRVTSPGGVFLRPDLLGAFPVFYAEPAPGCFVVGASPWLLASHPAFQVRLELAAVVALLLAHTLVDGLTIFGGVHRLRAGHALRRADGAARELPAYWPPVSTALHDHMLGECAEALGDALASACRRHLPPGTPASLLLSGGLDSRLLAGLLAKDHPDLVALTWGRPADFEAQFAGRVCRTLALRHEVHEPEGSPELFRLGVRWDGLVSFPGAGTAWSLPPLLRRLGRRVVAGHSMDVTIGGPFKVTTGSVDPRRGFARRLSRLNTWGVPQDQLRGLLRPEVFGDRLEDVEGRLAAEFVSLGEGEIERNWRWALAHRQRLYVSRLLWQYGLGAWPVTPATDRKVIETAGSIPLGLLAGRMVEREILRQRCPALATIPLDRNSYDTRALDPRLRDLILEGAREFLVSAAGRLTGGRWRRKERRQYHRQADLNGPVWRAIRVSVEPYRALAHELFDRAMFDRLVPPPTVQWEGENAVEGGAGLKSLLGIMAWLGEFRPGMSRP